MPQTCTICKHPQLSEIHEALIRGVSLRNIAKQFNVGYASVFRHKHECLKELLAQASAGRQLAESENAGDFLGKWYREIHTLYDRVKEKEDIRLALYAIDRALKCIELVQKQQMGPGGQGGNTLIVNYVDCRKPWEKEAKRPINER